jgi:predicted lipoprotein with Yx(FWY)xxD motif
MTPFRITVLAITALVVGALGLVAVMDWQQRSAGPSIVSAGTGAISPGGGSAGATGPASRRQVLMVGRVDGFTPIVTNAQGRPMYRFDQDSARPPLTRCVDECARRWQPVLVGPDGVEVRGKGIESRLVGSLIRPEGTEQVTLNGWALYYNAADRGAGKISGYGREGLWWPVSPDGTSAAMVPAGSATDGYLGYY